MRTSVVAAVLSLAAAHYASAAPAPEPQGSGVVPSSVPAAASTAGTAGSSAAASSGGSPSTTVVAGPVATSNVPTSSNQKYVWAHHIVGVTQNYTPDRWDKEVALAQSGGIDGFALNMGADSWQPQQIDAAYTAAGKASGSPFKMFLSFDTTSLGCKNASDVTRLADLVNKYAAHPAQAQYKGKTLVSTFGGERCTFGEKDVEAGWAAFRAKVTQGMHFVPATFMTPNDVRAGKWFDGGMQWDGGWPMGDSALTTRNDTEWLSALGNKTYMAAVSPFFFTYYGPQSWDKNWIYRSDDWLLATRFEQMISLRDKLDMIEIVSWNGKQARSS